MAKSADDWIVFYGMGLLGMGGQVAGGWLAAACRVDGGLMDGLLQEAGCGVF